jgi:uncharacterized OsmC-like protein
LSHHRIHARDCQECETEDGRFDHITRDLELMGTLDAYQLARLLEIAARCPVHQTLMLEVVIDTNLVGAE